MKKFLYYVITVLAVWLLVSPFLLKYMDVASTAIAIVAALASGVIAVVGAQKDTLWEAKVILGLSVLLTVWGLIGLFLPNGAGLNELLIGLLWGGIAFVISQIQEAAEVVAYDVYGNPMAQITKISFKKEDLVAKAMLLGSMPSSMYLRPEEIWKLLGMVSFETIMGMPKFLVTGAKRVNGGEEKVKTEEQVKPT